MANIGTFTAQNNGFTGTVRTLTLNVKVKLVPNDKGGGAKAVRPGMGSAQSLKEEFAHMQILQRSLG